MKARLAVVVVMTATTALWARVGWSGEAGPTAEAAPEVRGVPARALLLETAARLHKNFIWDPRLPEKIEIGSLRQQELTYPELLALLRVNGFIAYPNGPIVEILPDALARTQPLPIQAPDHIKALDDEIVSVLIPLKNTSAAQLVPILRPCVPQWGHLVASPEHNALMLTDRAANARRLVETIHALDNLPKSDMPPPKEH
jgi:general secretion pathway protein D